MTTNSENNTVGIFYEKPDKTIVYTYGFNGKRKIVYCQEWDKDSYEMSYEEFQTLKPRRDLKQFPQDPDTRLPYVFDLYWDIKWLSELRALHSKKELEKYAYKLIKKHNIKL